MPANSVISKARRQKQFFLFLSILFSFLPGLSHAQFHYSPGGSGRYSYYYDSYWEKKIREFNLMVKEKYGKDQIYRNEFGAGIIFTSANLKFTTRPLDEGDPLPGDTSMAYTMKPNETAYHVSWNSGKQLTTFGDNAALILSFGLSCDNVKWKIPKFTYMDIEREYNFSSTFIGVPLFLDYMTGAEAVRDVAKRFSFNVGAGFVPSFLMTTGEARNTGFNLRTGARVEFGLCTKILNFKLQAMGLMGDITYANEKKQERDIGGWDSTDESYDVQITGKSQFVISLILIEGTQIWAY